MIPFMTTMPPNASALPSVRPPCRARRILAHFGLRAKLVLSRLDGSTPTAEEVARVAAAIAALDDLDEGAGPPTSPPVRPSTTSA